MSLALSRRCFVKLESDCALCRVREALSEQVFLDPDDFDFDCVVNLRVREDLALFSVLADRHFANTVALAASS